MATTIKLKNGSGAPLAGDLVQGEPALDLTNKRLYTEDSGGTVIEVGTNPTSLTTTTVSATGSVTGQKLVASDGLLELDDNGTHNGIINVPASLFINIDSDNTATTEDFVIAKDRTSTSGGTELFRVQEDGNVGIGTASPDTPLEVSVAGSGATDVLKLTTTATNSIPAILFEGDGLGTQHNIARIRAQVDDASNGGLVFETESSGTIAERLRIDSSGNVGIGQSSPATKLHVAGQVGGVIARFHDNIAANCYIEGSGSVLRFANRAGSGQLGFTVNNGGSDAVRIDQNGNVGIGTTSPAFSAGGGLQVQANTFSSVRVTETGNTGLDISQSSDAKGYVYLRDNADLIFGTNNAERMRIDSSGRVGIGMTPTDAALQVSGDTYTGFDGPANVFLYGDANYNDAGNAGAGILFGGKYTSAGSITAFAVISGIKENTNNTDYSSALTFQTRASSGTPVERMRIDSSGNVGIGTSSPSSYGFFAVDRGAPASADRTIASFMAQSTRRMGLVWDDSQSTLGLANLTSHDLCFHIGGIGGASEKMRIDTSGNVGIGTTTPNSAGNYYNGWGISLGANRTFIGTTSSGDSVLGGASGSAFTAVYVNAAERMRINSDGAVLVGTTSGSNTTNTGVKLFPEGYGGASTAVGIVGASSTSANSGFRMYSTGASAYRFYVDYAGTIFATSTSISAISDASLKENVRDLDKGLDTINALQPRRFDWKNGDGNDIMGFIAQEVEEVMPELVHDYKYTDEENKKGLKMGDMVPSMVKAIQELSAQVNELKAEVAALKGA